MARPRQDFGLGRCPASAAARSSVQRRLLFSLAALVSLSGMVPAPVAAAVPAAVDVEGVLVSSSGTPAADGTYDVSFAIYSAKAAPTAAWAEGPVTIAVAGGRFRASLGVVKPLDGKALAGLAQAWLGVQVGADPELPRQRLVAAPYALAASYALTAAALDCAGCVGANSLANGGVSSAKVGFAYAGSATKGGPAADVDCSGCVGVSDLQFDGDVDLAGNSIKAKNGTFGGDLVAKTVVATAFVGDGSKLTGIQIPTGSCSKPGELVKGIAADGSLVCAPALDPSALPKDGLDEISNGLMTSQFTDIVAAAKKNVAIPDNTGVDAVSDLTFPDLGVAQTFTVSVTVASTNLNKIAIVLLPPDDKKAGYTLCDPCAANDASKTYKGLFPPAKAKAGQLSDWVGKNPKGLWSLKVKDSDFCVPQKPGNETLCNPAAKTDGAIVDWSIQVQTLSAKKVAIAGELHAEHDIWAKQDLHVAGALVVAASTGVCNAAAKGAQRWLGGKGMVTCDGAAWVASRSTPVVYTGYCSLSRNYVSGWNWYCLNVATVNTAADYLTISTYAPPSGTTSNTYDVQWQGADNPNKIGRIDVKVGGYYRVSFHVRAQPYAYWDTEIVLNNTAVSSAQSYRANAYVDDTHRHDKIFKLAAGDVLGFRSNPASADNANCYAWLAGPASSYVSIEYLGAAW